MYRVEFQIERRGFVFDVRAKGDATFEAPDPDVGFDGSYEVQFRAWIKRNKKDGPKWTDIDRTRLSLDAKDVAYIEETIAEQAQEGSLEELALRRAGINY